MLERFFDYRPEVLALDEKAMQLCAPYFRQAEQVRDYNQLKMLRAFTGNQMSSSDLLGTTGYGLWDTGRAKLEAIFAQVMGCEDALVRSQFMSGTHTLAVALFGLLRAGDTLLAATGRPYDTLEGVIGIEGKGEGTGTLTDYGVRYEEVPLKPDFTPDYEAIAAAAPRAKVCHIQRSRGYLQRNAFDLHPDYFSTREAQAMASARGLPLLQVQHHWAHMAACMADNQLEGPAFGIVWDGTGLGDDGGIWGGEFLRGDYSAFERVGSIRPVLLPGGDAAVKQIGRTGLALAWDAGVSPAVLDALPLLQALPGRAALLAMLEKGLACPAASSIGRLFDGVYALLSGRVDSGYDGQAPALLEALARPDVPGRVYPVSFAQEGGVRRFDTRPLTAAVCADVAAGVCPAAIARGFMDALARMALAQCRALNQDHLPVVLSGGVFLNQYLLRETVRLLEAGGFAVHTHHRVSPSDEGLALGQLAIAARARQTQKKE